MENFMKLVGLTLILAALAVGAVGCGGSDEESTISKTDFIAQANEICKTANDQVDAASNEELSNSPTNEEIEAFWNDTARPSVEDQVAQIRELGAPEGDEEQIDTFLTEVESATEEAQSAIDNGTFGQGPDPFAEADRLSIEYGLTDCAS
jgi:hypothetical protein